MQRLCSLKLFSLRWTGLILGQIPYYTELTSYQIPGFCAGVRAGTGTLGFDCTLVRKRV